MSRANQIPTRTDKQLVVFSDLDGSLLDHDTYDWTPARPALEMLRQHDVPLVLVSSKTLAELDDYRQQLRLDHPVIAENGAAMWVPEKYFTDSAILRAVSLPRAKLRSAYESVKTASTFQCEAFYELGVYGIIRETGLTEQQAERANARMSSEPILWRDTEARRIEFERAMKVLGLRCVMGGRFLHLMGETGKEEAVHQLLGAYAKKWPGRTLTSVALGDGPNDLGMLASTNVAVIIPGRHNFRLELNSKNRVLRAASPGPAGWNEAMLTLLAELYETPLARSDNGV
ncbi:MAG: HAD-IIB family hydrolase [Gammaproteobacteria bacterium]